MREMTVSGADFYYDADFYYAIRSNPKVLLNRGI